MTGRSILLVEDDPLLRELLGSGLSVHGFTVTAASSAADAKRAYRTCDPDGAVIDIELGPGPNGLELAEALRDADAHLPIVFLTNLPDPRFAHRSTHEVPQRVSYLRKSAVTDIGQLVAALDDALRGANPTRHDLDPSRPMAVLTRKQIEVLRMVADGHSNAQIAQARGITVKAVEDTVSRACSALGLDSTRDGNVRVAAARRFLSVTNGIPVSQGDSRH